MPDGLSASDCDSPRADHLIGHDRLICGSVSARRSPAVGTAPLRPANGGPSRAGACPARHFPRVSVIHHGRLPVLARIWHDGAVSRRELNRFQRKILDDIVTGAELGFRGEVADLYHMYRHGYPAAVFDALVDAFGLSDQDVAVDLGCGTGQLTLPMAGRVRAVLGMDPEPDMLRRARRAAQDEGLSNVSWMIGADTDVPALRGLLGDRSTGAVTIGQALHWMRHEELFRALAPLLRAGGGIAVVTNGTPLWLQQSDWSRALRAYLERWLDTELTSPCGTDEQSQRRYQEALARTGFEVSGTAVDHAAELNLDQLIGSVYSALPTDQLPAPDQRLDFAEQVRAVLGPHEQFSEPVHVAIIIGRVR